MKKSHFYSSLTIFALFLILLFVIFYLPDKKLYQKEVNKINEANLCHLDSIAFSCVLGLNRNIGNSGPGRLVFPVKEKVRTYFLDGTIADSSLCKNFFIGYPSKDFVYILDIYLAKSQKSSLGIAMIYKKIKTHEITTDPRSTIRWASALNKLKTTPKSLKDFVKNVCFPGWEGYIPDEEYIFKEEKYFSPERFASSWEKEEFVNKLVKKILAEKGNSTEEKLLNFSKKIIQSDFTDWINEEI